MARIATTSLAVCGTLSAERLWLALTAGDCARAKRGQSDHLTINQRVLGSSSDTSPIKSNEINYLRAFGRGYRARRRSVTNLFLPNIKQSVSKRGAIVTIVICCHRI
jgi:hypothetical protein